MHDEPGAVERDADGVMDAKNTPIGVRRLSRAKKEKVSKCKVDLGWISSSYRFLRQFEPCQCLPTSNFIYMVLHGERYDFLNTIPYNIHVFSDSFLGGCAWIAC